MKLIQRVMAVTSNDVLSEYEDVFQGIGCLEGEHSIKIDENITPKIHPPREVPVMLRDRLKAELDRMEKLQVIRKIEEPTKCFNPIVIVEKADGSFRVCLDPRDLCVAVQ